MKNSIIFVMLLVGIGKVLFPSHILVDMSGHWTILLFALCYLLASGNFDKLINRLTRIKIPGVEAQLAEMKTVRDETVASASEMKKLKKDLKDATFASARQQALLIMQIGRFVSDDHITERVKSVKTGCGPCVSSLAALGLGEPYGDTRIGWVDVGGGGSLTGALEYFHASEVRDLFEDVAGLSTGSGSGEYSVVIGEESVDWILMNPPYSRTRGGQSAFDIAGLTKEERKACQKRWGRLVKNEPVNNKAGMAASFLALARRKIKRNGRIGFVLPLTAAFADSWAVTRQMIEQEFTDITAIAVAGGQALGREALSADTDMEEMLLVATRRPIKDEGKAAPIHCVTLHSPPSRIGEASEIARAIEVALDGMGGVGTSRPIMAGEDELGQVAVFDAGGEGAPWGPLGVTHVSLALAAGALTKTEGKLAHFGDTDIPLGVDMSTIDDVFEVGPTHHRIGHLHGNDPTGAFEFHPVTGPTDSLGKDRALWEANSTEQRKLVVLPTHKRSAPVNVGSDSDRQAMRACQSTLFYARNMRWTRKHSLRRRPRDRHWVVALGQRSAMKMHECSRRLRYGRTRHLAW